MPVSDPSLSGLVGYLDSSPSPRHAVATTVARLEQSGHNFTELHEGDAWGDVPDAGYVVRGGAIVAWRLPHSPSPSSALRIVGAHTDSPCLRVNPLPDTGAVGWKQLGVEVYGGILNNSWLDRDLGVAGYVVDAGGAVTLVNVDTPIARVPQLAVHLDRTVNEGGLTLDRQQHLTPVWGLGAPTAGEFANWIGNQANLDADPKWWELCLYDTQGAAVLGADRTMLASGRLDNLLSCWAATEAIIHHEAADYAALVVLNDHEEVGSASVAGAAGPLLETVLARLVQSQGGSAEDRHRCFARSMCISADNAHAVHPNYPDRHDPGHRPAVNAGPALKVNANQRYATSAETAAAFQRACEHADVPWQVFVSRNNMPCGSTIGPLTATRLGIATADIGIAQLSMHSARELCGTEDPIYLTNALTAFFSGR